MYINNIPKLNSEYFSSMLDISIGASTFIIAYTESFKRPKQHILFILGYGPMFYCRVLEIGKIKSQTGILKKLRQLKVLCICLPYIHQNNV